MYGYGRQLAGQLQYVCSGILNFGNKSIPTLEAESWH